MKFTLTNRIDLNLKINFNFFILIFIGVTLSCNSSKNESENSIVKEQSENYLNDSLLNEIKWILNSRRVQLLIDTSRLYGMDAYPIQTFIAWSAFDYTIKEFKVLGDTLFLNEKIVLADSIIKNFHINEFYLNTTFAINKNNFELYYLCDSLNGQTFGFERYHKPVSIFKMWNLSPEEICYSLDRPKMINDWFKRELKKRINLDTIHCTEYRYYWKIEPKRTKLAN